MPVIPFEYFQSTASPAPEHDGASSSIFSRIRFPIDSSILRRQTTMVSIPSTYGGPTTPAVLVIAAVLGTVGGVALILCILFFTVGGQSIAQYESVVVSETRSRRTSRRRPPRQGVREVVEPMESVTSRSSVTEENVIEVYDEESDSYTEPSEPPRRPRRPGGYRTVHPDEYAGRDRPMRKVR